MNDDNQPLRVLHILSGLNCGGAESFVLNMYRHIDREKVQFDFLLRSNESFYKSEFEKLGSKIYVTASFPKHFLKNALETQRFFKEHSYSVVHVHANALLYTYAIKCAAKNGTPCRIIHSHNASMAHMFLLPIHTFNKKHVKNWATDFFACSDEAGRWMFDNQFSVIHNAVDTEMYRFNEKKRVEIRSQLGIKKEDLVIGHVGRFTEQKNHIFLINILVEIVKENLNSKLILVGDGELRQHIEAKVKEYGLSKNVFFLGARSNVAEIMNAFDVFVFPSKYEGLPFSVIEAQANGLAIFCSEAVSRQAIFSENAQIIPLEKGAKFWARSILESDNTRKDSLDKIRQAGFDAQWEAKKLERFYLLAASRKK